MPVVNNWSRVLNSSTCSTSGTRNARPGYRVPASVPLVWLTRTPAIPAGTMTMPAEISSGAQASITSATGVRQRIGGCKAGGDCLGSGVQKAAPVGDEQVSVVG